MTEKQVKHHNPLGRFLTATATANTPNTNQSNAGQEVTWIRAAPLRASRSRELQRIRVRVASAPLSYSHKTRNLMKRTSAHSSATKAETARVPSKERSASKLQASRVKRWQVVAPLAFRDKECGRSRKRAEIGAGVSPPDDSGAEKHRATEKTLWCATAHLLPRKNIESAEPTPVL
jgi:hypothetical protein